MKLINLLDYFKIIFNIFLEILFYLNKGKIVKIAKKLTLLISFFYFTPCLATFTDSLDPFNDKTTKNLAELPESPTDNLESSKYEVTIKCFTKSPQSYEELYKQSYRMLLDAPLIEDCSGFLHIFMFTEPSEHLALEQVSHLFYKTAKDAWILKTKEHLINPGDLSIFSTRKRKFIEKKAKELATQGTKQQLEPSSSQEEEEENAKKQLKTMVFQEAKKTIIRNAWIRQGEFNLRFHTMGYLSQGFYWLIKASNAGSSYARHRILDQFLDHFSLIANNKETALIQSLVQIVEKSKKGIKRSYQEKLKKLTNSKPSSTRKTDKYRLRLAIIQHLESKLSFTLDDSPYINQLIKEKSLEAAFFKVDHYRLIPKGDASQLISEFAKRGDAKAQLYHALKLLEEKKLEEATVFLTLAASQNNAEALYRLGVIELLNAHSTKVFSLIQEISKSNQSQNEDLPWILETYKYNPQAAQKILLGEAFQRHIGTMHLLGILAHSYDIQAAAKLITAAAALGHPDAQFLQGMQLWHKNPQAALKMLFLAALQAQPNALFAIGLCRFDNEEFEDASEFISHAINLGYSDEKDILIKYIINKKTLGLILKALKTYKRSLHNEKF